MNGVPDEQRQPTAVVWYRSRIVTGIVTIIVSRALDYAQKRWHFDATLFGITANDLVSAVLDGIGAIAAYVALHARVSPSIPIPAKVTLTQASADQANATNPTQPPLPPAATPCSTK